MKNKIKSFAKGEFKLQKPEIIFSDTHIVISVGEGELYQGSFIIQNQQDGDIRGIVYPSSFRVHFTNQGFEGNPAEIKFIYDSTGMLPGEVEKSTFTVVCNGGEYNLDLTAIIEKPFVMTSCGKVQSLRDFKKLAMQDFEEARHLFRSRRFADILRYEDSRIRNLYTNMRKWALDEQALEEFLVGIKQKEKIFLTLSDEKKEFHDVLEDTMDYIEIQKNTWGYVPIRIWADGDFIRVKNEEVSTDDFVGNTYRADYFIRKNILHSGYNYGVIYVETPYETLKTYVQVYQHSTKKEDFGVTGMIAGQGLKDYLMYVGEKQSVTTWCESALQYVTQLQEAEPNNEYYTLLRAHVCLQGGRREEAKWIMQNFSYSKYAFAKKPELQGYYLFVSALLKNEPAYTNKIADEVTKLFMKNLYSWPLLLMVTDLDVKFKDCGERIRVYERQFSNGANSILLFAEAYKCFRDHVILLRKLTAFEIQVLDFATKYKIVSHDIALHMSDLILQQKKYDKRFVRILKRAYKIYEEPRILQALCSQLISGNHREASSFIWYSRAVKAGLKIAQLYEYFMLSLDERKLRGALPQIVYLYFLQGNQLNYRKTAALYANILTYEDENSEIYKNYEEKIQAFALEQLLQRHVDDNLRIIYKRFLKEEQMTPEQLEALYDICYAYQIISERQDMKYVLVIEKDGSVRQRVPHKEEGAFVYLYDKEARIIWEGKDGTHYTDSIPYDTKRLFYEMSFINICRKSNIAKNVSADENEKITINFENLKRYNIQRFDEQEVFLFVTKYIREQEEVEAEEFLTYLCFVLLKKGVYDKCILTYLCQFYCGATADMKFVWKKAKEYGIKAHELTERIITQMLFSEVMFGEEEIFEEYYQGKAYFRLKQAYLAYVSKEYVANNRIVEGRIFDIIIQEIEANEYVADICKAALLKYFVDKDYSDNQLKKILYRFFRECCEAGLVFSYFQSYPKSWLREVQLHDKVLVEYHANNEGRVQIVYQINQGEIENLDYETENLVPIFENIYVKEFVLYEDEKLKYYFVETAKGSVTKSERQICTCMQESSNMGRYGRINRMLMLEGQEKEEAMKQYQQEDEMANRMFPIT